MELFFIIAVLPHTMTTSRASSCFDNLLLSCPKHLQAIKGKSLFLQQATTLASEAWIKSPQF